jgi:ribose transport system permease protein
MTARRWLAALNTLGTFAALLLIFGYFAFMSQRDEDSTSFATFGTVEKIARQTAIVGIAAMGMTLIIISGGIDLSVGSVVALVTVVIALLLKQGYPPAIAATVGILAGGLCGAINGLLITSLRVVPFIVTLGMLGIVRGAGKGLSSENPIYPKANALNAIMAPLGDGREWMIFPVGVWVMIVIVLATALMLRYTRFGRHVVAIGSNEATARLCGVPVNRVKVMVYTLAGLLFGVAGLMQFSRLTIGDPTVATGLELNVIAAVVIGGGSLAGGEGSAVGSLVGAAIMTTIASGGSHLEWRNWVQEVITGMIIIVAVALDRLRHRRAIEAQEG